MKLSVEQFKNWENKCITLLGMSGVGKTHLANMLMKHNWFHYSGDYRIGTRYLDEPILDNIKQQAMQVIYVTTSRSIICNRLPVSWENWVIRNKADYLSWNSNVGRNCTVWLRLPQ